MFCFLSFILHQINIRILKVRTNILYIIGTFWVIALSAGASALIRSSVQNESQSVGMEPTDTITPRFPVKPTVPVNEAEHTGYSGDLKNPENLTTGEIGRAHV